MTRRMFAAFAAVVLCSTQAAFAEPPRPAGPGRHLFQLLDTNQDGRLSPWEFEAAAPPPDFALADSDAEFGPPHDGPRPPFGPPSESRREGRPAIGGPGDFFARPPMGPPPAPEELFDRLDEDGDGRLSRREFLGGLPPAPPPRGCSLPEPSGDDRSRRSRTEGFFPPQRPSGPSLPPELEARLRALETELRSLRANMKVR